MAGHAHTHFEDTRVFWVDCELPDVVSLSWLANAGLELTGHLAAPNAVAGFQPVRRTRTIRDVGTYFTSNDYTTGTVRCYDVPDGGGPVRAAFPPDRERTGHVVFTWDGDTPTRALAFNAATLGAVTDEHADNSAHTFTVTFAIRGLPVEIQGVQP